MSGREKRRRGWEGGKGEDGENSIGRKGGRCCDQCWVLGGGGRGNRKGKEGGDGWMV